MYSWMMTNGRACGKSRTAARDRWSGGEPASSCWRTEAATTADAVTQTSQALSTSGRRGKGEAGDAGLFEAAAGAGSLDTPAALREAGRARGRRRHLRRSGAEGTEKTCIKPGLKST